jgi:predicted nucleic acid-binding protein
VVNGLLDTAVLVDLLRAYPPAGDWLSKQPPLGVSPIVWLEVIEGAENKRDQIRAIELLKRFERVEVLKEDFDWAIQQALRFRLSHNINMNDCLIASTAYRLKLPIFTTNLKHFRPLLEDLAQQPY